MSSIAYVCLLAIAAADHDVAAMAGLPGGGQVELIAVGNADGDWWKPNGEIIDDPDFVPQFRGNESTIQEDAEWYCFIVRKSGIPADQDVRITLDVRRPDFTGGSSSSGTICDVHDRDGKRVDSLYAYERTIRPVTKPGDTFSLRITTEFGEWTEIKQLEPTLIDPAANFTMLSAKSEPHGIAEVQAPSPTTSMYSVEYRDRDKFFAVRAKLHFADGTIETWNSGAYAHDSTMFRKRDWQPKPRPADSLKQVTIEIRNSQNNRISGIPIYRVGQIEHERKRAEQLPMLVAVGVAGLLAIAAILWLAIATTKKDVATRVD